MLTEKEFEDLYGIFKDLYFLDLKLASSREVIAKMWKNDNLTNFAIDYVRDLDEKLNKVKNRLMNVIIIKENT